MTHGSGDYAIAFTTAKRLIRYRDRPDANHGSGELANQHLSPLFLAVVEATEEAIYNAMFGATTMRGYRGELVALPVDRILEILRHHRLLEPRSP